MNIPDRCIEKVDRKRFVLEEMGSKATFENEDSKPLLKIIYDGCVVDNELAADYVIIDPESWRVLIVELKGKNVEHAIAQIEHTVQDLRSRGLSHCAMSSLIVARQYPHYSTRVQRLQTACMRRHKTSIRVATSNKTHCFDRLCPTSGMPSTPPERTEAPVERHAKKR